MMPVEMPVGLIAELDEALSPAALEPETKALIGLYAATAQLIDMEADYLAACVAFGWGRWRMTEGRWLLVLDEDD
jgi:hypothetical protein